MLKLKIIGLLIALRYLFCPCQQEINKSGFADKASHYRVYNNGKITPLIEESSGLEKSSQSDVFYLHADGGNAAAVYKINGRGKVLDTLPLPGSRNRDWEDISSDSLGYCYIGDFGNNNNQRRDLLIYKFHPDRPGLTDTIRFHYPDQQAFPPPRQQADFDCEAFFWYKGELHLFSKNRGRKQVRHYTLPDHKGSYTACLRDSIWLNNMVTAADVSPDGQRFALLAYGKIYLFHLWQGQVSLAHPYLCKRLPPGSGQVEALTFINNTDMLISNETGRLFRIVQKK